VVMKRSDPFFATIAFNRSCMNLTAWSLSIWVPPLYPRPRYGRFT
jgi:hypothetical protein